MENRIIDKLITITFLFYICISCNLSSDKIISQKDFKIIIDIDSSFMNFDIDKYNENKIFTYHDLFIYENTILEYCNFYTPDSLYYIEQFRRTFGKGYLQIVRNRTDNLFYDSYYYYPSGILERKSSHFRAYPDVLWGSYYEFTEIGELKTLIKYDNSKAIDIAYIISLIKEYDYNFFDDWEVNFGIKYRNKQEYSDSITIYTKYSNPLYCIEMTDYDSKTIHYISLDGISGEIETDCFFDGETIVCKKGSEEDLQTWSSPVF